MEFNVATGIFHPFATTVDNRSRGKSVKFKNNKSFILNMGGILKLKLKNKKTLFIWSS